MGLFSCKCDKYQEDAKRFKEERDDYNRRYYQEMDRANNAERKHIGLIMRNDSLTNELNKTYEKLNQWEKSYESKEIIWKQRYIDLEEKYRKLILDKVNEDEKKDRLAEEAQT